MYVDLDEDQYALASTVAEVAEGCGGLEVLRGAWADPGPTTAQWEALGDLGLFGMLAPEPQGLGLGALDLVAVARAYGFAGCPGGLLTQIVHGPLVANALPAGTADRVLSGQTRLAVSRGHGAVVPHARGSHLLAVHGGDQLRVYARDGVSTEPLPGIDGARGTERVLRGSPLVTIDLDPAEAVRTQLLANVALAAQLLGQGERLVAMSVQYACEREQFGVPIGSFQAIQHRLVEARVALDRAWPSILVAAGAIDTAETDAGTAVSTARVLTDDAADLCAHTALQTHGAMGYTREHPLHLLASAIWGARSDFGDREEHLARLEALVLAGR